LYIKNEHIIQSKGTQFIAYTSKDKSVISRELKRNATPKDKCYFEYAQQTAEMRKECMKIPRKLTSNLKKEIVKLIGHRNKLRAD